MARAQTKNGTHKNGKTPRRAPTYFVRLEVENVRCFGPRQVLDLSDGNGRPRQWTVILGDNGVGKTTLLQCLAACEPAWQADLGSTQAVGFPTGSLPRREGSHASGIIAVTLSEGGALSSRDARLEPPTEWRFVLSTHGWVGRDEANRFETTLVLGYGGARRAEWNRTSTSTAVATSTLFDDRVELPDPEQWLIENEYAALKSPDGPAARTRDRIVETLKAVLPEVDDIRFPAPDAKRPRPEVEVRTPYGWVRMGDLSLGYRTLITWMVDLVRHLFERYPESHDPLAEPAVVLVDEIDLHLHPAWQRKLLAYLSERFPNTQFIVTAHSPLVVQAARGANLVVLRREGDHVVIDQEHPAIEGWRVDQLLTSDLFGLPSARPPELDAWLQERHRLLAKPKLTKADQKRLDEIERKLGELPTAESQEDMRAMDIIRRAAGSLKARAR
jgi:energy-coupling factor transporter ATP-binding protein EcfA2